MAAETGVQMTDPRELLEVYDPEGSPTGVAKARGPVHLDGDWHLAFFCWVARPSSWAARPGTLPGRQNHDRGQGEGKRIEILLQADAG